jgi:hypothetical protein
MDMCRYSISVEVLSPITKPSARKIGSARRAAYIQVMGRGRRQGNGSNAVGVGDARRLPLPPLCFCARGQAPTDTIVSERGRGGIPLSYRCPRCGEERPSLFGAMVSLGCDPDAAYYSESAEGWRQETWNGPSETQRAADSSSLADEVDEVLRLVNSWREASA